MGSQKAHLTALMMKRMTKRSCVTIFYFYQKYFVMLVLFKIQATTPLEKFSTAVCIDVQIISCEK